MSNPSASLLDGFVPKAEFASANDVCERTVERYIAQVDGMPHLIWGGRTYIPLDLAREWLRKRISQNNPRRRAA